MKVVLFCGGLGMRLREYSERIPKPMVEIGYRPILWHVMKYYASFGHTDFVLCLGYRSDYIKKYFLNYEESLSNDFVLSEGGDKVELLGSDIHDWNVTFVDTGFSSTIGERLRRVREHLAGEEVFLANYSDNLTDFQLPELVGEFTESSSIAGFLCVRPTHSFHVVQVGDDSRVSSIEDPGAAGIWINGGCFVLRPEIFEYMREGEELVHKPFARLIDEGKLMARKYEGFWKNMDTFKDKSDFDDMYARGDAPWEVWKNAK